MGNLAWSIDEAAIGEAFADCGAVVSIKWFEEKETKKFLGAGVVEFDSAEAAAKAVAAGRPVLNRDTKIRRWEERGNTAEEKKAAKASKFEVKPLGPKPPGCYTLFLGNLNFAIDDDAIYNFFKEGAGAEMSAVRWLLNKETGEFRGVGSRISPTTRISTRPPPSTETLHGASHPHGLAGAQGELIPIAKGHRAAPGTTRFARN